MEWTQNEIAELTPNALCDELNKRMGMCPMRAVYMSDEYGDEPIMAHVDYEHLWRLIDADCDAIADTGNPASIITMAYGAFCGWHLAEIATIRQIEQITRTNKTGK